MAESPTSDPADQSITILCEMHQNSTEECEDDRVVFTQKIYRSGKNAHERPASHESTDSAAFSKRREIVVIDDDGGYDDDDDGDVEVERFHVQHVGPAEMKPEYGAGTTDFTQAHCCNSGESEPLFPLFPAWLRRARNLAGNDHPVGPFRSAERKKCNDLEDGPTAPWTGTRSTRSQKYSRRKAAKRKRDLRTKSLLKNRDRRFFVNMQPGECEVPGCLLRALNHGHFGPACDCSSCKHGRVVHLRRDVPYPLSRVTAELFDHERMHLHKNKSLSVGRRVLVCRDDEIWCKGTVIAQVGGGNAFGTRTWQVLFDDLTTTQIVDGERRVAVSMQRPKASELTPALLEFYEKHVNGRSLLEVWRSTTSDAGRTVAPISGSSQSLAGPPLLTG